ncbi:hypothetical protein BGZ68_001391, partial [Mortierella alpina]
MDVDNPPVVDRLARLQALVSTKERTLSRLQEQFEDALLDSEFILDGQPHDQKERLTLERDALIAALKGNITKAESELTQAQQALNRRLFPSNSNPSSNTGMQLFPPIVYQDACNVPPVYSNKEHGALVRIGVKGSIPVFPSFKDEPDLERISKPKTAKRENFEAKLVELIFLFLNRFEKFYRDKLADLFDILAYRYMSQILTKADLEQRLDQRFDDLMNQIAPASARTWHEVVLAMRETFRLHEITGNILERVFTFRSLPQEDSESFARRFENLLLASGLVQNHSEATIPHAILIGVLFRAVPSSTQNLIMSKFSRLHDVEDYTAILT